MARRGDRPPIGVAWIMTWPLSAALAVAVFLSAEELRHPTHEAAPPPPAAALGGPDWAARFPARSAAIDAALHRSTLRLPKAIEDDRGSGPLRWTHRLYVIDVPRADQAQAEAAVEAVRGLDPGLAVSAENTADGTEVRVGLDGLLVSTLRFRWIDPLTPVPAASRVAIIFGPLGDDLRVARQVVAIDGPIALAIPPARPFSREAAELGRMFGRDVLLAVDTDTHAADTVDGPAAALDAALAAVPQATAVLWMATRTPAPALRAAVARHHLLFVGDQSRARADGAHLPALTPLADGDADAIAAQLGAVLAQLRGGGTAIIMGAPTDAALQAIERVLPDWKQADVELVPVTALESAPTG
jgi:hypothetical protein